MIKLLTYLLFTISTLSFSQSFKTIKDSIFVTGDVIKIPEIRFYLHDRGRLNDDTFKIISEFINSHKNLLLEIASHTDTRGKALNNYTLSVLRARYVKEELVKRFGVDSNQIVSKGYGATKPIKNESEILKAKTKQEKEELHQVNRRVELKVIRVNKTLKDKNFNKDDQIKIPEIIYGMSNPFIPQTKDSLKPVADFLLLNKNLVVELGCHTDSRGNSKMNIKLSEFRAISLRDYLVKELKIDSSQVKCKGYGASQLIISDRLILNAKTKEEKEHLHRINRRTELKVVQVKP